jgi:hypothetical protein
MNAQEVTTMPTATKLDMKRELKDLYAPPTHPVLVEVPPLSYLMIDGVIPRGSAGPAEDAGFRRGVGSLYAVSYTLKFEAKAAGRDFVVMPLEGLFATDDEQPSVELGQGPMRWTLMQLQPPWITQDDTVEAVDKLVATGRLADPPPIRLGTLTEGPAAQVLHLGPYAQERPTIEKLQAFIAEQGLVPRPRHHEIYLTDPNRTRPERLKTVIRLPVSDGG